MRVVTAAFAFVLCGALGMEQSQAADWPVFGQNPAHTGVAGDTTLNASNVSRLHPRWRTKLGAVADSAPIIVGERIFQTAKDGTTYALDASTGRIIWRFATSGPNITTSVPAYDPATRLLYAGGVDGYLHRLDPATGRELRGHGFPAQITMSPGTEKNASPLNVANGYLYAQTSGYLGDATPYVGHVVAIRLSDGSKRVFNTLCSAHQDLIDPSSCPQQRSGMWSRSGVVVDPDPSLHGRIYGATGNGPFDAGAGSYGDSVLALSADARRLLGYATPANAADLDAEDLDVGSSSPALLPRRTGTTTLLAVQGGKDAALRLLDRANLGGVGHAMQTISLADEVFSAPAVWTDRSGNVWVFLGLGDGVHAYRLEDSNGSSRLVGAWRASVSSSREGSSPAVSDGVVFVPGNGALVALDAENGHRLWSHAMGPVHWQSASIAGGTVYCSDEDGYLNAFAL
jgi:outer membrane protein assembly factor BamB